MKNEIIKKQPGILRLLYATAESRKILITWDMDHFIEGDNRLSFSVDTTLYKGLISITLIKPGMDSYDILFHETGKLLKTIPESELIANIQKNLFG